MTWLEYKRSLMRRCRRPPIALPAATAACLLVAAAACVIGAATDADAASTAVCTVPACVADVFFTRPGDLDCDGQINAPDVALAVTALFCDPCQQCDTKDTNGDGIVSVADVLAVLQLSISSPTPTSTPALPTSTPGGAVTPSASPPSAGSPTPSASTPTTRPTDALPADPREVAPPLTTSGVTDLCTATAFLYTGPDPIQTGVTAGTIDAKRAAVIRGRVFDRAMQPLPAVQISIVAHPEYGQTLSRSDGMFDLAVNGGGPLVVRYARGGFFEVQREVHVPWQDYVYAADVVLSAPDATATAIDLTAPLPMQVARGSMVSDDAGARRATLLFPQGTQASFRLADGTTQPAPTPLTIRQTEYTVGATGVLAMPAGLPPSSAYTYNVELSADEERAAGAIGVVFNQPVIFYVENFIGFPVGEHAPAGFYDRQASAWKGEPDGRVVEVVAIAAGAAALDTDGDGSADNGIGTGIAGADLGITLAERQQLATLYAVGQTLWRVTITHFSPLDLNWGGGPTPPGAIPPGEPVQPRNHNDDDVPCPECATQKRASGSIIEIPNQTLGEEIDVVGTGMTLNYRSDRTPAAGRPIRSTSPSSVPRCRQT